MRHTGKHSFCCRVSSRISGYRIADDCHFGLHMNFITLQAVSCPLYNNPKYPRLRAVSICSVTHAIIIHYQNHLAIIFASIRHYFNVVLSRCVFVTAAKRIFAIRFIAKHTLMPDDLFTCRSYCYYCRLPGSGNLLQPPESVLLSAPRIHHRTDG